MCLPACLDRQRSRIVPRANEIRLSAVYDDDDASSREISREGRASTRNCRYSHEQRQPSIPDGILKACARYTSETPES
jgi:hypothetical protein